MGCRMCNPLHVNNANGTQHDPAPRRAGPARHDWALGAAASPRPALKAAHGAREL